MRRIPPEAAQALRHYVYALTDPGPPECVFYIGRGVGDRVLAHGKEALLEGATGPKVSRIQTIRAGGHDIRAYVVRHGLTRQQAIEVEAALIDALAIAGIALANAIRGEDTERGARTVELLSADLTALPLVVTEPALLVVINNTWVEGMDADQLWDAARREWTCNCDFRFPFLLLAAAGTVVRGAWRVTGGEYRRVAWSQLDDKRRNGRTAGAFGDFAAWKFDGHWASDVAPSYVGRHVRNADAVPRIAAS
jgi:hypothetical protein